MCVRVAAGGLARLEYQMKTLFQRGSGINRSIASKKGSANHELSVGDTEASNHENLKINVRFGHLIVEKPVSRQTLTKRRETDDPLGLIALRPHPGRRQAQSVDTVGKLCDCGHASIYPA